MTTLVGALKALFGQSTVTTGITSTAPAATPPANGTSSDAGTPPALLRKVVSTLTKLDQDKQQGIVPSKELLKQAQDAVQALSSFLASQQPGATSLAPSSTAPTSTSAQPAAVGQAAAPTGAPASTGTPAAGPLPASNPTTANPADGTTDTASDATSATTPELTQLSNKLQTLSASVGKDQADLGAGLSELARQLDPKTLAPATATQLGFASDSAPEATGLTAAVDGLVHGKAAPVLGQPALAAPTLKLDSSATPTSAHMGTTASTFAAASADATSKTAKVETLKTPDADPKSTKSADAATTAAATPAQADKPAAAAATTSPADPTSSRPPTITPGAAAPTTSTTADLRQAQAAYQAADPMTINLPQMAFEIARHAQQGSSQFQISMEPKDLGHVDVKLAIDNTTGAVTAHLTADRPETLDLLKRDAGTLGQALSQAGLDAGKTNLQFSLNQNPFTRQDTRQDGGNAAPAAGTDDDSASTLTASAPLAAAYQGTATGGGLNIFV